MKFFKTPRFFRWVFPRRTWGFSRSNTVVYLTFDDGPNPEITPWILDCLKEKQIRATFFCVGSNVLKYPVLYQRILDEGHTIGNHTMDHEKGSKTSFKSYSSSIEETNKLVNSELFRPPYGRITFRQTRHVSKKYKIIMWSWLSYDYDVKVSVSKILQKAKKQIVGGDILVMHDNQKVATRVKEILPKLIDIVKKKGFSFAIVS